MAEKHVYESVNGRAALRASSLNRETDSPAIGAGPDCQNIALNILRVLKVVAWRCPQEQPSQHREQEQDVRRHLAVTFNASDPRLGESFLTFCTNEYLAHV